MHRDFGIMATKELILIRHGKSSWDSPGNDKLRQLTERGIEDARRMSGVLQPLLPESYTVWCSTAVRAASTLKQFRQNPLFQPREISLMDELYTFSVATLAELIAACPEDIRCLIVFGHNGAITDYVNHFGSIHIDNVPTCGIVCLELDGLWEDMPTGLTKRALFPKQL